MKKLVIGMSLLVVLVAVWLAGSFEKETEVVPEFVLTYAENQSKDYPTTVAAYHFAELVKERTEGKVVILIKYSSELGTQEDIVQQMKFGGVDLARVSISSLSDEIPSLNVLQLPFLYETEGQMWDVLESDIGEFLLRNLQQIGLIGLSWYEAGARGFYSSEAPIAAPEDLQGKIVRIQDSSMMRDWIKMLGGDPIAVPYSDVYSAFETKQIEVAENSYASYRSEKHYEVAKYYTEDEHTRIPEIQIMSARTRNELPFQYRNIIAQCAKESAEYEKELWDDYSEAARREAIAKGCEVVTWSEEDVQKCKDMLMPLYEKYCSDYMYLIKEIQEKEYEIH